MSPAAAPTELSPEQRESLRLELEASRAVGDRGLRFDAAVQTRKGWHAVASGALGGDPNEKPLRITGHGATADAAYAALLAELPPLARFAPKHCPTCTCTG